MTIAENVEEAFGNDGGELFLASPKGNTFWPAPKATPPMMSALLGDFTWQPDKRRGKSRSDCRGTQGISMTNLEVVAPPTSATPLTTAADAGGSPQHPRAVSFQIGNPPAAPRRVTESPVP